jgi:ABC-type branched-subunit amino acid transport system substrate-binding protein
VGITVAGTVNFTPGADSPAAVAQQIIADKADTIVSVIQPTDYIQVANALRTAGHTPTVALAVSGYDTGLLRAYGPGMAGITIPIFYRPFESGGPAISEYQNAMARYAPQIQQPDQDFAIMSYIQTDMFIRGLEAAGSCPTRQSFIDGLRSVRDYDAGGLIQPIDIRHGLGKQTTCWAFVQANNAGSAFEVVEENLCGKEITP